VFVLGVERRSGTNFLSDLLCIHPDARKRPGLAEDFLLKQAGHLENYVTALRKTWPARWPIAAEEDAALLRNLGDGLLHWLADPVGSEKEAGGGLSPLVVTKTPTVANLELGPLLWPDATFLLLVRDGRALVESGVRSFDWNYRTAMRRWSVGARSILDFDERHGGGDRSSVNYKIVRYENLVARDPSDIANLMTFCGLDPIRLPLSVLEQALTELPVRGSSESRDLVGPVSWKPSLRGADFDPVRRFDSWGAVEHADFARLAGAEQLALGYPLDVTAAPSLMERGQSAIGDVPRLARRTRRTLRVRTRSRR